MDVQDDVTIGFWYQPGPIPGQDGSAVIAAHVAGRAQGGAAPRGLFYSLGDLEPGDRITIHYDDGNRIDWVVSARAQIPKQQLPVDDLFRWGGDPVVALVTCGGDWDPIRRNYRDNVVIYARPIRS